MNRQPHVSSGGRGRCVPPGPHLTGDTQWSAKRSKGADEYSVRLERATRGLLALNVSVLEHMERNVGLEPLRALQSLDRRGPSMVGELGDDLGLVPSTASRLSDRLAEAGLITRRPAPSNR